MGILSKLRSRNRGGEVVGARLKLYPVGDQDDDLVLTSVEHLKDDMEIKPEEAFESESRLYEREPNPEKNAPINLPLGWRLVDQTTWNLDLLQAMDWKLFEDLCVRVFRAEGFEAETTDSGPDGGIDIVAHLENARDPREKGIAVQCKRYKRDVRLNEVRAFFGAAVPAGHQDLVFITTSRFNHRVIETFAENSQIELVDGEAILQRIENLGKETAERLLAYVVGEDPPQWQTPTCPRCDTKMLWRRPEPGGKQFVPFWGCSNYGRTRCRQKFYPAKV